LTHNVGELDVGYIMQDNSCSNTDSLREGVVQFDFSHLLPYKIRAATFTMYVAATAQNEGTTDIHSNGSESESLASCAVSIGTPLPWNAAPNDLNARIQFTPIASLPSPRSDRSIRVDVTDLARTWAAAKGSNNGLVVSAKPQSLQDVYGLRAPYHSDQECLSAYTGLNIKIDYEL
jgi:hypothetical protein